MTDAPSTLSFDTADAPAFTTCSYCGRPLAGEYYTLNGQVACRDCPHTLAAHHGGSAGAMGVARAIGLSAVPGLLGAIVWWAIRRFASLEIGLIAIGIGHFVGLGVRRGSGGRGGRGFQVLAVALTYFWITANFVPDIIQMATSHDDAQAVGQVTPGASATRGDPAAAATRRAESPESDAPISAGGVLLGFAFLFGLAMAAPFLQGAENIIEVLIISFGLWQAWKLNAAVPLAIEGPFRLQTPAPATPPLPPPVPGV
ncbi:MAG: LIM domain-containing protein [Vicinamibacterales bacterium]